MPAKIVYGKKKTQHQQQQTHFTRLLSPEKADATAAEDVDHVVARRDWRGQLEIAAQAPRSLGGDAVTTGLEGLERGLGAVRIGGDGEAGVLRRKSGGMGKRGCEREENGRRAGEADALSEEGLERSMVGLVIEEKKEEKLRDAVEVNGLHGKKKGGRPRKALELRDGNAVKDWETEKKTKHDEKKRTGKSRERGKEEGQMEGGGLKTDVETAQTSELTPQTDARVRTPRRTPEKAPKAKRRVECTPTTRPLPSQLLTPEPTPEPDDLYTAYVSPLLSLSDRKSLRPFSDWAAELSPHFQITKIAEASFSEVYRLSSTSGIKAESVLKVVALKTPSSAPFPCQLATRAIRDRDAQLSKEQDEREERDQYKSHVSDVLSEVRLLTNLTPIPGFTLFRSLSLLRGRPSPCFTSAWHTWNRSRPRGKKSEFPDPGKRSSYDDTQLWAVIEMQDAGTDVEKLMEAGGLTSVWEVWDVFWGVACSIAKAEEGVRFEHRDLHLGNICVRSVDGGGAVGDLMAPRVKEPLRRKMRFCGLETTVIDYTLSRADILIDHGSAERSSSPKRGQGGGDDELDVAYMDLNADPALFEGDASQEYQYEIYRYMRGVALFGNPLQWEPCPTAGPDAEEEVTALTRRRSPRKNTHIRFDGSDDETVAVVSRKSPRRSGPVVGVEPESKSKSKSEPRPPHPPLTHGNDHDHDNDNANVWRSFHPRTNLIWLHFLLHKLLAHMQTHHTIPTTLTPQTLAAAVVPHASPSADTPDADTPDADTPDADTPDAEALDADKVKKRAVKLYRVLERMGELLCPVALGREGAMESAKELVVKALEERWVRVGDVEG